MSYIDGDRSVHGVYSRSPETGHLTQLGRHQFKIECDGHNGVHLPGILNIQ